MWTNRRWRRSWLSIGYAILLGMGLHGPPVPASAQQVDREPAVNYPRLRLAETRMIWDAAPHNAFTDLIYFRDQWWVAFREGTAHVSRDGALRILVSPDGQSWKSAALMTQADADLRDAKLCITPQGQLMLTGAAAFHDKKLQTHQTLAWFSDTGLEWSESQPIGPADDWLWRPVWHRDHAYCFGYACGQPRAVRLYRSSAAGQDFELWQPTIEVQGYPNETALIFQEDRAYCLLRRDGERKSAMWGTASAPYRDWTWQEIGVQMGGPQMLAVDHDLFLAAVRVYEPQVETVLGWIDPTTGNWHPALRLPSGGDTSYAGLVYRQGRIYVSYYSSHEGQAKIYWAEVELIPQEAATHRLIPADTRPLIHAHAHNDYEHPQPLRDALGCGFTSIEADVFWVNGQLLVGHTRADLKPDRTLETLYLQPLADHWRAHKRWFETKESIGLWLHIDIKSEAEATYAAIHELLVKYQFLLTADDSPGGRDDRAEHGFAASEPWVRQELRRQCGRPEIEFARAIDAAMWDSVSTAAAAPAPPTARLGPTPPLRIVISGNRNYEQIAGQTQRLAGIDGRLQKDLESAMSPAELPVLSDAWHTHFRWRGVGPMPPDEHQRLRHLVTVAHSQGRKVRFWATPEKPEVWQVLRDAEVDFINTDRLLELRDFLGSQSSPR